VVLRLAPWRARSVARVSQEWTSVSRIFHHPARPHLDELELSRTLELAAAVLGCGESRSCGPLAAYASSPTGNAWPPWQSWVNVRRTFRSPAPRPRRCRRVVALGTQRRRGTWLCTAHCEMRGRGHHRTRVPHPDHSIRRIKRRRRDSLLIATAVRPHHG
jgi:hypothetical protein